MKQSILLSYLAILIVNSVNASIIKTTFNDDADPIKVERWQVLDITFKAEAKKPFEKEWGAVITSSEGVSMDVPGFYNGADNWVIRFSASDTGVWSYETYSEIETLDGRSGVLEVEPNSDKNYHGSIVVSKENPAMLEYEDGTPYFLMAFELDWLFALDYGNSEFPKSNVLLNHIQEAGINHVVTNVFANDVSWGKDPQLKQHPGHEYGSPKFFPFKGDNLNPDYSELNTEYFDHFDEVISLLDDKNMVAHVMIYVWNKLVNWPDMYSKADNRYFDYVIKRYQAFPNMVWDISKEALLYGRCDNAYIMERIARTRKLDAYSRLLTVHDYGFCKNNSNLVDVISVQDWAYGLYSNMIDIRKAYSRKPVLNIEHGGYEESPYVVFQGAYTNAEICLRRNYFCAFSGAYSTYYWQATSWNVIIHNPFSESVNPQPHFEYYTHFTDFFNRYNFTALQPFNKDNEDLCLTNNEGVWMFYCPKEQFSRHTSLKEIDANKTCAAKWFNPETGEYSAEITGSYKELRIAKLPDNSNDWIYILKLTQ